jgi:hypothetical protein
MQQSLLHTLLLKVHTMGDYFRNCPSFLWCVFNVPGLLFIQWPVVGMAHDVMVFINISGYYRNYCFG